MSPGSQPVRLGNHHRNTPRQLFQHPASHNIEWRAVVSLLETVGSVVQHHGGPPLPSGLRPNSSTLPRTRTSTPTRLSTGGGC